jgi:tRNA pseudouridine32 synthase/23S rRNA pseudouridine746 synthase
MIKKEFHIPVTQTGQTALACLGAVSELSTGKIKQAMHKGCVWLERGINQEQHQAFVQRLRRTKKALKSGDTLHFYYDEKVLATKPSAAALICDLGDYSIWNKPRGMLSQGSKWGDHCTIYRWAEKQLSPERPAFIVHRLDKAASGLIILAHKKSVAAQFSQMFARRELEKHYSVVVEGNFSKHLRGGEKRHTINTEIDNKPAISHVDFISFDPDEDCSTLEVQIETGRKHQIRKHLSGIGCPVVGDRLYGSGNNNKNLQLKAKSLKFKCPVSADVKTYELP